MKVAPRLKYPLDACPPVRSDRLAKRQALDGHEQRAAQLLRRTDLFFSLRIILIPISSASEIQSAKIGTLYNRSVEGPVAHSLAVGRPDSGTAFSRGRDKWCHIKRVRELPFMTSTKFWDFLTPPILFVSKIYTVCPQIWYISSFLTPSVWTSYMEAP